MVIDAWKRNKYNKDTIIVEASSGNTGISVAVVAARKGLKCLIVVPKSISEERLNMLDLLVAKIVFVSKGIKETIKKS